MQTDDINPFLQSQFGFTDRGVHNNYLFTRDGRDYNAVQVSTIFGTFQIYDITDPTNAELVSWFGAEYVLDPATDWVNFRASRHGSVLRAGARPDPAGLTVAKGCRPAQPLAAAVRGSVRSTPTSPSPCSSVWRWRP